jgi:hypothetical protein
MLLGGRSYLTSVHLECLHAGMGTAGGAGDLSERRRFVSSGAEEDVSSGADAGAGSVSALCRNAAPVKEASTTWSTASGWAEALGRWPATGSRWGAEPWSPAGEPEE